MHIYDAGDYAVGAGASGQLCDLRNGLTAGAHNSSNRTRGAGRQYMAYVRIVILRIPACEQPFCTSTRPLMRRPPTNSGRRESERDLLIPETSDERSTWRASQQVRCFTVHTYTCAHQLQDVRYVGMSQYAQIVRALPV